MTAINYTAITTGANARAATFNSPLQELDNAIENKVARVYNVKGPAYGALGDNSTDDAAAIQSAIDACEAAGGGIIWFPKGTYKVLSALTIDADSVILYGAGPRTAAIHTAFVGPGVTGSGTRRFNCGIHNMMIYGDNGTTNTLLDVLDLDEFFASNLYIYDCDDIGITIEGNDGSSRGTYLNCHVGGCENYGVKITGATQSAQTFIGGEYLSNEVGMWIETANNVTLLGVWFENAAVHAAAKGVVVDGENVYIAGCRFELNGATATGIELQDGANGYFIGSQHWSMGGATPTYISFPTPNNLDGAVIGSPNTTAVNSVTHQFRSAQRCLGVGTGSAMMSYGYSDLTVARADAYSGCIYIIPCYTGAYTVTRHNYIRMDNPTLVASAVVTDAAVIVFDAAAGTHKAVDAGTTKTTPGTVNAWMKINVNGVIYYIPAYTSKTS